MDVIIRETRKKDYSAVEELLKETDLLNVDFHEKKFKRLLMRNKGCCYVAEVDERIIGSAFATHDGAFYGYIYKVAVDKDYQRQGIASKLIERISEELDSLEIKLKFAHVNKKNTASIKLLKSLGFEIRDSHYLMDKGYKY